MKSLRIKTFAPHLMVGSLLLLGSASSLAAQEDETHGEGAFHPVDIVSVATGDFDRNGSQDAALLVLPGNGAAFGPDLHILLKGYDQDQPPGKLSPALSVPNAAIGTAPLFAGQVPALEALPDGSLQILSLNTGIGRAAWEQRVTLASGGDRFHVTRFQYNSYDKLQEEPSVDCELDLSAGKGVLDGKAISFEARRTPFEDWDDQTAYGLCGIGG
ncbi:hypothetical protein U0C82_07805 [Fulvimarina sp. 2208YS6-2-32]|uniref:VCBS repeat-containing protein n=1 Tax=Fulvimarina uroteuthidis TaxID=3098149 RepID=A0ABU5I1N0_9HYPH|nr:hypothetical protein [Fulvimarina sp. 2208YS6-2-32]MDY8109047.1 hypothetical protein [Fulvimarina sp. 2208YS6-2-32]